MRRAKIVCTLGPAVESVAKITELVEAGMNMARLNLSHGEHIELITMISCSLHMMDIMSCTVELLLLP